MLTEPSSVRKLLGRMAGNPRKKARREAAERAAERGETVAEPLQRAGVRDVRAAPARPRGAAPGPAQRKVVDNQAADQLRLLAEILQPGVMVTIERTKPRWCAGELENYELEDGNIEELHEYIREEWGGQKYSLLILHPNGTPAFTTTMKVAGPPLDGGQRISRRQWRAMMNGEDLEPAPATAQASAGGVTEASLLGLIVGPNGILQTVLSTGKDASDRAVGAMQQMSADTKSVVSELVVAVGAQATAARAEQSLGGQLKTLGDNLNAVEDIKETIAATIPQAPEGDTSAPSPMMQAASAMFAKKMEMAMDPNAAPPARPRKRKPGKPDRANGIPSAQPGGHGPN